MRAGGSSRGGGRASDPIILSSSESESLSGDLKSALAEYSRANMPRDNDGLLARTNKGKRRVDAPPPSQVPASKRQRTTQQRLDHAASSQTTLTQFPDIWPLDNLPTSSRRAPRPHSGLKRTSPKSTRDEGRAQPKQSRLTGGNDLDHAIIVSDDEPKPARRPPRQPSRTHQTVLTPRKVVHERRTLVPETVLSSADEDVVLVNATISPHKNTLVPETILSQTKPSISPSTSKTRLHDDNPFRVGNLVSPAKVRRTPSLGGGRSGAVGQVSAGPSTRRAASRDASSTPSQRRQRSATATTTEERRELQRQANHRLLSLSPQPPPPQQVSILDELALTPTPKKPRLSDVAEEQPSPSRSAKKPSALDPRQRRLQFAPATAFEDESYRPNPRTKSARRPGTETMRVAQARPRRYISQPGRYTLPDPNTPIHQWPSTAGTTHTKRSVKKERPQERTPDEAPDVDEAEADAQEGADDAAEADIGPAADGRDDEPPRTPLRRSRSLSSELTPLPPTQAPRVAPTTPHSAARAPHASQTPHTPRTPLRSRLSQPTSLSRASQTSLPRPHTASLPRPSQTSSLHRTPKIAITPSAARAASPPDAPGDKEGSPTDNEDDLLGLDLYADFAQYAASPASSMRSRTARPSGNLPPSPLASKTVLTPAKQTSSVGPTPRAPASARKNGSQGSPLQHKRTLSQASQSSTGSVTARILALEQDQAREAEDDRARARKAAEEREQHVRKQLMLLEGTDDEDEDGTVSLSQILGKYETENKPNGTPGRRRSSRRRKSASDEAVHSPPRARGPPRKTAEERRQAKFFTDMGREYQRGTTTAQVDATMRRLSEEKAEIDLTNTSGIGDDVIAAVKHIQDVRDYNERVEASEQYAAFWDGPVREGSAQFALPIDVDCDDPAMELLLGIVDDRELLEALACLPPTDGGPVFNKWLFTLALCTPPCEVSALAVDCVLQSIACATSHPFGNSASLVAVVNAVLYQLGGKVDASDLAFAAVTRTRESACVVVSRVISAVARADDGWVTADDALRLSGIFTLLAADSSTPDVLARDVASTLAELLDVVSGDGQRSAFHNAVVGVLGPLPLHAQVRALLTLRSGGAAARTAAAWLATDLLAPGSYDPSPRPSVPHVLGALEAVRAELREDIPDFVRVSGLLALWGMAITDLDWAPKPTAAAVGDSVGGEQHADTAHTLIALRNLIPDDADDVLAAEVKGRLQLFVEAARLHSDTARDRARHRRISRHGLELGHGDQTRLSLGR